VTRNDDDDDDNNNNNNNSRIDEKGWSASFGFGRGANSSFDRKTCFFAKYLPGLGIEWIV
jgi:hypothetical protein